MHDFYIMKQAILFTTYGLLLWKVYSEAEFYGMDNTFDCIAPMWTQLNLSPPP